MPDASLALAPVTRDVAQKSWPVRGADYCAMRNSAEFVVAAALFAMLLICRVVNIINWQFDTDESQHAHVIWGWARGFVEYRDLCDNHMPLFHLLFVPLYQLIGDRPTILIWLRFALLPIYLLTVWATYRIGELLYSRRVGAWSALLVGFYPGYYLLSAEFRTDNLWAPLWIFCLLVLLAGPLTLKRSTAAGLLLGFCFGISMKTTLLVLSLAVAAGFTLIFFRREIEFPRAKIARCCVATAICAALVPLSIMAGFARAGLWPQFRYWVFENNVLPGLTNHPAWWKFLFPALFPFALWAIWSYQRALPDRIAAHRRTFVLVACAFYVLALWSYWPLVTRQDYLPFHPLAFIFYTAAILSIGDRVRRWPRWLPAPALIIALEFIATFFARAAWRQSEPDETKLLRAVVRLTNPGDFVLDLKGETVFRQRAYPPLWEPLVMERIRRGLIIDDAPERCIALRTCVATKHRDMSARATQFVEENYLPIGDGLYVAGRWLHAAPDQPNAFHFVVAIPERYVIASRAGMARGTLDGQPFDGPRFLQPGAHEFIATSSPASELAFYWAQAAERTFTPFP
ncbi:MAG: glycosyltransferase family 39 protein [Verrucomicrobiota bacterium]|nr:glycosyltransferase family 39 protein [Verrucomicrobiota bacterium]